MPYGREKEYKKSSPKGKLGPKPMKEYQIGGGANKSKNKGNLKKKAKMKYSTYSHKY